MSNRDTVTTVVPLEWQRYRDRLHAEGWSSESSCYFVVDLIADEMFDQYVEAHGYSIEDDDLFEQVWELAVQAAVDLDGEWP
jgi:hypothetical protein